MSPSLEVCKDRLDVALTAMGGVGSQVGLDDLKGLFQPHSFCVSVKVEASAGL